MRHTVTLAAALALWAAPALASHITPQTFATTPADPPEAAASPTAPGQQGKAAFPFYTPMPAAPAQTQPAPAPQSKSAFPFYTPMPAGPANAQTTQGAPAGK